MRTVSAQDITRAVRDTSIEANCHLPTDVTTRIEECRHHEDWPRAQDILSTIEENIALAAQEQVPLCQDTGMACVFIELGQDVHVDGDLVDAVNAGVAAGYREGYLRKSMVSDPLRRTNTGDNTPALIHVDVVPGDRLTLTVAPKGAGSENMGRLGMLKPSDGIEGFMAFVVDAVRQAGPNPCPPIVVGVGVGGNFDQVALLAKRALLRPLGKPNPDTFYAGIESSLLGAINALGIGPQGFGGRTTALGVAIEMLPTHIASLPVAVNINCHVARHATRTL
jgi:fumarate hydratase subunit alpha